MNSRVHVIFSAMMIVLLALFSAISVIPARADDGAPPPPAAPSSNTPSAHLQVPAGTDVTVVNAAGHKVSLASQEAAHIVTEGDPIWCPTGVTPGGATCSASFGNLQALVAAVGAGFNPAKNGAIWIQNTTFPSTGLINFDGSTPGAWATWSNFSLTFKGGWSGSGAVITTTPSTIQDPLSISNWHADVTLNNIVVTNVVGAGTTALFVGTSKKIVLTTVSVDSNDGSGADLDNSAGTSDVTVTSSEFNENNGGDGLYISSRGAITLSDVTADFNQSVGAHLDNSGAFSAKSVTLKSGPFEFNNNSVDIGLEIYSRGSITLMNIAANTNGDYGAYLDNTAGTTAAAVSITGTNFFSENSSQGLYVLTNGAITANNLVANSNGGYGAWLDNCQNYLDGSACTTATVMPVKLTGSNQFKFNAGGLRIVTNGVVTLSNINASNNGPSYGAKITNDKSLLGAGVTMTGTNTLDNNGGGGLFLYSRGAVTISNLSASGNGGHGAVIWNNTAFTPKPVTLSVSGGNPDTNTNNNNGEGLWILSKGAISLTGISASNNNGDGAMLENDNTGAVGGVTISGWGGAFTNNYDNGLLIRTTGAVNITGLYAGSNGFYGVYIDNHLGTAPVTLGTGKNVSLWNNTNDGLDVYSRGAITINNINADGNSNGAVLQNDYSGAANVIIKNSPTFQPSFNNNWFDGLVVHSLGSITLMDVNAQNNGQVNFTAADTGTLFNHSVGFGIVLDNHSGSGSVTIGTSRKGWCNSMSNNFQSGLVVHSSGAVTMSNMCNDGNGGYVGAVASYNPAFDIGNGAYIDNSTGFSKPVTLKNSNVWNNEFNSNYSTGLVVLSQGAITATALNANWGTGDGGGAFLNNTFAGGTGAVTITSPAYVTNSFDGNPAFGLEILSYRTITVSNLDVSNNGGTGAILDNTPSTYFSPQSVTIKGLDNNFNGNGDTGLVVKSYGLITLNNIDAQWNGQNNWNAVNAIIPLPPVNGFGWGAFLDNCGFNWGPNICTSLGIPKGISVINTVLNSSNQFNGNFQDGLWATSLGPITVKQINARDNGSDGAYLDNHWPGGTGGITLTSATPVDMNVFNNNGTSGYGNGVTEADGLEAYSNRTITLNDVMANGNHEAGVVVDNGHHFGPYAAQNVSLTGRSIFDSNGDDGLKVWADGNITIKNLSSTNNGQNHSLSSGWGAWLDNCLVNGPICTGHGNITLTGTNAFNQNYQTGLWAVSHGNIAMSNVTADGNGNAGVGGWSDGKIFVSCGSMTNNVSYGWWFQSLTTVTLKFVTAFGNNGGLGNTYLAGGTLITSPICP